MKSISRSELGGGDPSPPSPTITDATYRASYSWIESTTPTIAVPGIPAEWCPPTVSKSIPKDTGLVYISQNAARLPESPLEPLFRALYKTSPAFEIGAVDLVSDRNNIRKLLSFVDPISSRGGLEAFTINAELVGSTVLLCRTDTKTMEVIPPHEFRGFGHEFEKAYTKCLISDSTGHHRVISYRFGGMSLLIRHEVDGHVASISATNGGRKKKFGGNTGSFDDKTDLSKLLDSLSLQDASEPTLPVNNVSQGAGSRLLVRQQGQHVPAATILEIKTRVAHKLLPFREVAAQLWISQTPKLVRAYHQKGIFGVPQVTDMTADIQAWEQDNATSLAKLSALMKRIIQLVTELGGRCVIRYNELTGELDVERVKMAPMLPADLYSEWGECKGEDEDEGEPAVAEEAQQ